ncbi:hypothetical protein LUZ28_29435, partial [Streptomyces albireticuli]|nr:hypothetical protein [Streptomyces albireticuli]MCD9196554.1 hypothetical protein [Streptomyces albireticuli]
SSNAPAWLGGCRRLHRRHERKPEHSLALAGIAAALICYRRLPPNETTCKKGGAGVEEASNVCRIRRAEAVSEFRGPDLPLLAN